MACKRVHVARPVGHARPPRAGMPSAFSIAGFKPRTYCMTPTPSSMRVEFRDYTW